MKRAAMQHKIAIAETTEDFMKKFVRHEQEHNWHLEQIYKFDKQHSPKGRTSESLLQKQSM